jgi:hypothetical protein
VLFILCRLSFLFHINKFIILILIQKSYKSLITKADSCARQPLIILKSQILLKCKVNVGTCRLLVAMFIVVFFGEKTNMNVKKIILIVRNFEVRNQ